MKLRHLRVLPVLFVCMQLAFAQQWRVQSSGTAAALKKIQFVDSANGWTVGEKGTLLATSDGGAHWRRQTALDSTIGLTSLSFIDQHRGWVIGGYDAIATTSDGGSTWTRQTSPLRMSMSDVRFTSRDTGWIVGSSRVLRTFDGGTSWQALDTIESISCIDAQHCWACGSGGRIWRYDPTFISTNADIAPKSEGPVRSISILQHGDRVDVRYLLATPASIGTELYDVLGKKVAALPSIESGEGIRISSFDADALPAGVYYILSTVGGRRFVNTFARTK